MPILKKPATIIGLTILGFINLVVISGFFSGFWSLNLERLPITIFFGILHAIIFFFLLNYFRGKKNTEGKRKSIPVTETASIFCIFIGTILFLLLYLLLTIFFLSGIFGNNSDEEAVAAYMESIRNDRSRLTSFFKEMPKGGDLHHHFTGSLFAETYWDALVEQDGWINLSTLEVDTPGVKKGEGWKTCSQLLSSKQLSYYKQKIIQQWSVKDYYSALAPSDKHFFDAFDKFRPMSNLLLEPGLKEIKVRALSENVSYIETMLMSFDTAVVLHDENKWVNLFQIVSRKTDFPGLKDSLNLLYEAYMNRNIEKAAVTFCSKIESMHNRLILDDSAFTIRYLTYGSRVADPLPVFRRLLLAFEAADRSDIIVGVNFVSPEDNSISMRDYTLHMRMFEFFRAKYPNVKISLHAGELTPGLVKPELLKSHIYEAVFIGQANRIGHGVAIAREDNYMETLQYMRGHFLAVEINLVSNEYILKVKDDAHPILLYHLYNVPIVLSTDDAGILRTDMTTQFVLAASRYPSLRYKDLKSFVRNSLLYSFIEDQSQLNKKLRDLDKAFITFEKKICVRIKAESELIE